METYPTVKVVWGRRYSSVDDSLSPIEIEIYYKRKRKWISTGVKARKENWSDTKWVIGRADAFDANLTIETLQNQILSFIRKIMIDKRPFTWSALQLFLKNRVRDNSFLSFVQHRVTDRNDIKESTRRNHKKFAVALAAFGKILSFNDLNVSNIQHYDVWLRGRNNYTQSTIASYHKYMKLYINDAIRLELTDRDPYRSFKVDNGKPGIRKYLTMDELIKIQTCNIPNASINRVRDMFVFQCFTGLAYSDLKKFDYHKVQKRGNRYILHDIRRKTQEDYYIVILPTAFDILKKYDFILPVITNEQYNMRLKIVAEYAGIQKNLTSHMGRHTFATMSLNSGIKIEVLAQMMGHSDIKTTQIYAKMVNSTVEEAYEVLESNEKVKSMVLLLNDILSLLLKVLKLNE